MERCDFKLALLQQEQLQLSTVVSRHDAMLESDRNELRQLEEQVERLQSDLLQYSEATEKSEGYGELLKERTRNLEANREQLILSLSTSESRHSERKSELDLLNEKLSALTVELDELRERLSDEEAKLIGVTGGISQEQEESLKGGLLELMNQMAQARNEIRYTDQQKEALERRVTRVSDESGKWEAQQAELEQRKRVWKRLCRNWVRKSAVCVADIFRGAKNTSHCKSCWKKVRALSANGSKNERPKFHGEIR